MRPPDSSSLRESVADALRLTRTALLWLAGPLDAGQRLVRGRRHLPPLWLRRHAGPVRKFESSAREMAAWIERLGLVQASDRVLDIGCGPGSMAAEFSRILGPEGTYLGVDVHTPSLRWCKRRFQRDPRMRFALAAIASPYGSPRSRTSIADYRLPLREREAEFILAKSLFTHLLESEARHYLSEIRRVLRPGRGALITAFLFGKESQADPSFRALFPVSDARGQVRFKSKARPRAAVAFERSHLTGIVEEAGLRVQWFNPGFWPGGGGISAGQDMLLLGH